ncbi:unnamed protein product [Linum trigynum]|uniref:Uncharacterized protein n=1 Tax=Linum trigynum TaxID=586398 RepID=A0AAV2FWM9_9ROSI
MLPLGRSTLPGALLAHKPGPAKNPFLVSVKVQCFQSASSAAARTEAQAVLFEYLYSTRSLRFTDAEYISKNSPRFLRKLLSEVDGEKDVEQSLTKFLMYNPINEFEPFMESLGVKPSEYSLIGPRKSVFLGDDKGLLDNFHVLVDYGVPRHQIGKMFRESFEVFMYGNGVLASKLQAYEDLGLSKSVVIKLVICCPSLLIGDVDNHFVELLERLHGLGIGIDWISRHLTPKGSYNWRRMLETINFLEQLGCNEEHLQNLFEADPTVVFEGSGKKVYLLLGQLIKLGLEEEKISSLFIEIPEILSAKYAKNLMKAILFLFDIGMDAESCADVVSTHVELLSSCPLKQPKSVCKDLNIDKDRLLHIIREDPVKLFSLAGKSKSSGIKRVDTSNQTEKQAFLIRLGYVENSDEMMAALKKFRGRGDQLQERFDFLVQAGLDPNLATSLVKRAPMVLNQTTEVLEKKIDCLTSYLGYHVNSMAAFPAYLCYDVEKINKRFRMYVWLRSKGAAKAELSLSTILACSDKRFVKYFVDVHPDGTAVWGSLCNDVSVSG